MSRLQPLLLMALVIGATATAQANGLNAQSTRDKRAAFSPNEREWILREAYACSRNPGINEGGSGCVERESNARQLITDRSNDYVRRSQQMREEMRRIHEKNSIR